MKKKKLFIAAIAVCLVSVMALGSLAYFTSTDSVTNKFMTASYNPNDPDKPLTPEEIFSVQVLETQNDGSLAAQGKTYEGIVPGDTVDKDPTVKNTGKYDQWVRATVTLTNASAWQTVCQKHGISDLSGIFGGFDAAKWSRYDEPVFDSAADTLSYTFYLNDKLAPEATAVLFTSVTIPAQLDIDDMISLSQFELTVSADAIQSDNTGDSAKAAFDAYWQQQ